MPISKATAQGDNQINALPSANPFAKKPSLFGASFSSRIAQTEQLKTLSQSLADNKITPANPSSVTTIAQNTIPTQKIFTPAQIKLQRGNALNLRNQIKQKPEEFRQGRQIDKEQAIISKSSQSREFEKSIFQPAGKKLFIHTTHENATKINEILNGKNLPKEMQALLNDVDEIIILTYTNEEFAEAIQLIEELGSGERTEEKDQKENKDPSQTGHESTKRVETQNTHKREETKKKELKKRIQNASILEQEIDESQKDLDAQKTEREKKKTESALKKKKTEISKQDARIQVRDDTIKSGQKKQATIE